MRFYIFSEVTMSAVLWDVISCSVIQVSSRFRGGYGFHLQDRGVKQSSSMALLFNPETLVKHTALSQIPENTTSSVTYFRDHFIVAKNVLKTLGYLKLVFQSSFVVSVCVSCTKGITGSHNHDNWL